MAEAHKPVRVAVNVMRARQTVVGFNIAVLSIQIAQMARLPGGLKVSGMEHAVHLRADLALFMALALALLSLLALTLSSDFDEVGYWSRWTLPSVCSPPVFRPRLTRWLSCKPGCGLRPERPGSWLLMQDR